MLLEAILSSQNTTTRDSRQKPTKIDSNAESTASVRCRNDNGGKWYGFIFDSYLCHGRLIYFFTNTARRYLMDIVADKIGGYIIVHTFTVAQLLRHRENRDLHHRICCVTVTAGESGRG